MTVAMSNLEKVSTNHYRIPRSDTMNIDCELFLSEEFINQIEDDSLTQLKNAASLRGVEFVGGMPDVHVGYGVPVGCVMAMNAEKGLISAGAVGMDINCGMRLLVSDIPADQFDRSELKNLVRAMEKRVPTGIGTTSPFKNQLKPHIESILTDGVDALVELDYARTEDAERIQDGGHYPGAKLEPITDKAWDRLEQLGTLGGGNHFLELVRVDQIYNENKAQHYRLNEGRLGVVIHSGSRGFGHQICTEYSDRMYQVADQFDLEFPTKNLASAPIHSDIGQDYLGAMACAANIAYANRQMMAYSMRDAFSDFFNDENADLETAYDITHNLARFESVNNEDYLIHRKGAVRVLPAGHEDNPELYRDVGHPVIIPGNMAIGTYILSAGRNIADTFHSVNHGAGRRMSRNEARDTISEEMMLDALGDVILMGAARKKIRDEAPQAYKDVNEVIDILTEIDVAKKIAHLKPLGVIKGD